MAASVAITAQAELLYGVTFDNQLITFGSATPSTLLSGSFISGLGGGNIVGIDFRPATGVLYGLATNSNLYTINLTTGAATLVGPLTAQLSGSNFGTNFNPVVDRLRIVSDIRQNLRVDPSSGATTVDPQINYVDGTTTTPQVSAVAYTNHFPGATSTTLYGIDAFNNSLVSFDNPNLGSIRLVGPLGFNSPGLAALTISGASGTTFASIQPNGVSGSSLYTINLATGQATSVGDIGPGGAVLQLRGLTVAAVPEPASFAVLGIGLAAFLRRKRK
ncbi:MAG: hypothetical protein C4320_05525 [Armatimonadota bacterium]